MFIKTKENEITRKQNNKRSIVTIIVIEVIVLIAIIVIIAVTNRRTVLEKVGKLFNEKETNKTVETMKTGTEPRALSIENWDTEKVEIVEDTEGVKVPVPKGYVASGAEGEHTVKTGFVIYEGSEPVTTANAYEQSKIRNQWVWVPVADASRIYERNSSTGKAKAKLWSYGTTGRTKITDSWYIEPGVLKNYDNEKNFANYDMQGMTKGKLQEELEQEYEATMESIEKYGGFYIGRYETGNVGSGSSSNHNTPRQPVVKRMNTNISYVKWYDAYNNMQNIQRNENIKSNIIWGSLWDETVQWLVDSGSKTYEEIKNSVGWGNHWGSEFDYINASGAATHKNVDSVTMVPTGSSEQNKANNIYDMAGNVFEWTLEATDTDSRGYRGGSCNNVASTFSVDGRYNKNPTYSYVTLGVRAYFYIK